MTHLALYRWGVALRAHGIVLTPNLLDGHVLADLPSGGGFVSDALAHRCFISEGT
jgi:hypothetical protein